MLPSPTSSLVFAPRTNTLHALPPIQTISPSDIKLKKRPLFHDTIKQQKRLKLDLDAKNEDEDVYMEPQEIFRLRARQNTRFSNTFSQFTINPAMSFRRPARTFSLLPHFTPLILLFSIHLTYLEIICLIKQIRFIQVSLCRRRYISLSTVCLCLLIWQVVLPLHPSTIFDTME